MPSIDDSKSYAASLESIRDAQKVIGKYGHTTQVLTCHAIDRAAERRVFFKCENLQKGGAFKFRGACNAVFSLSEEDARRGVVTHSSGNHAGALALAAQLRGIPAHIVVPSNTPQCKLDAIATYGGKIVKCTPTMEAREAECERIRVEIGADFVAPYNDARVISGQGTVALELLDQVPELDAIVVPVSGGGLISGISIAAKALRPDITIIAAEPLGDNDAADCAQSLAAGKVVACPKPRTIADGLQGRLGSLTWPPVRDLVSGVITVTDPQIVDAMRLLFERMKVVVEPSGAASLAAVLSEQMQSHPTWSQFSNVGVIISGGNIDLAAKGFWQLWQT